MKVVIFSHEKNLFYVNFLSNIDGKVYKIVDNAISLVVYGILKAIVYFDRNLSQKVNAISNEEGEFTSVNITEGKNSFDIVEGNTISFVVIR